MARTTMTRLIDRVRTLTYAGTAEYTVGTASFWDADHVQEVLDANRRDVYRANLHIQETYDAGAVQYKVYEAHLSEWETTDGGTATFVVQTSPGVTVGTASYTADYQRGVVTFTSDQAGAAYLVTGRVYDIYAAAADLLEAWAAREARQYEVETPAVRAMRQQKMKQLLSMAGQYRAKSSGPGGVGGGGGGVSLYRSDMR
jgi:hypothetical protein